MYAIKSALYLDKKTECYIRLITINTTPSAPLKTHCMSLKYEKLSPFDVTSNGCDCNGYKSCIIVLRNPKTNKPFCIDEITECVDLIISLGYTINYNITKLLQKNTRVNTKDELLFYIQ